MVDQVELVERLRRSHGTGDLQLEAADVIEGLVEALQDARSMLAASGFRSTKVETALAAWNTRTPTTPERSDDE